MQVRQDAVGNICGRYEGTEPEAPALLLGSHLDTVRNAGKYDGMLGVVTAINGAKRRDFSFKGMAGHAGTVPMALRQDELVGASELILTAESIAKDFDVVATVGKIACHPGAVNVIPSDVLFTLDIRAPDNQQRDVALEQTINSF
jgi:acetylornithine deacetylase/succinyl-diaminopimelate desuccinylase-like protein